jgi:hypothetical protein
MKNLLGLLLFSLSVGAAVTVVAPESAVLTKGTVTVGTYPNQAACIKAAQDLASAATLTTGVVSYACTTKVTATYSATPPPSSAPSLKITGPAQVPVGGQATWAWTSTGVTTCQDFAGKQPVTGTKTLTLYTPLTYALLCSGTAGSVYSTFATTVGGTTPTPPVDPPIPPVPPVIPPDTSACNATSPVWTDAMANLKTWDNGKYVTRMPVWLSNDKNQMWAKSSACWGATTNRVTGNIGPGMYAEILRGWPRTDRAAYDQLPNWRVASGMGIAVKDLKKAKIHWSMVVPATGRYQALIDIYFHAGGNITPDTDVPIQTDLMINQLIHDSNFNNTGDGSYGYFVTSNPACNKPEFAKPQAIAGQSFFVCINKDFTPSTGNTIQLFLAPRVNAGVWGQRNTTIDIKGIIDYFVAKGYMKDTEALNAINAGWELDDAGVPGTADYGTFKTVEFCTSIQNEGECQ